METLSQPRAAQATADESAHEVFLRPDGFGPAGAADFSGGGGKTSGAQGMAFAAQASSLQVEGTGAPLAGIPDDCLGDADWSFVVLYTTPYITPFIETGSCLVDISFQAPFANQWCRVAGIKNDLPWTPSTDGTISDLTLELDTRTILPSGERVYLCVLQNGQYFTTLSTYVHTGSGIE